MADKPPPPFHDRIDAPVIAFDDAPCFTARGQALSLTLSVDFALPGPDGQPHANRTVACHLRTDITGARNLYRTLERAILAVTPASGAKN